ncbi:unnamed protein product, partial [Effrenium voratum]
MYVPTHASELEDLCPRAAALQAERDWEVGESIQSCAGSSAHAESVEELYSKHPYPSWRRFASSQTSRPKTRVRRSLLAGVGTGKAILAHLEHFEPEEILAVDLSESSLRVAKRQLLALGFDLSKVSLRKCDLFSLEDSERFDVIESVGVVHHLPDPRAGLRKLRQLLAVEGTLVLGLYSRTARRSVNVVRALAQEAVAARGAVSVAEVEAARDEFRDWLAREELFLGDRRLREEELFYRQEFLQEFSLGSRSNFEDLLFHPVEHLSELPELEAQLGGAGLRFSGVRVPAEEGVARRWSRFFTADRRLEVPGWPQMPLLAFLHRLETEL